MMDNLRTQANSSAQLDKRLAIAIALNTVTVIAEVVGGLMSGSLALLSDALHNLSDVGALAFALAARIIARRRPSGRHTFGFHRLEVIAAFVNGATLLVVSTLVVRAAILRLIEPQGVDQQLMLFVAAVGLGANLLSVVMLHSHDSRDLNVRAAFLHLVQDTASSVIVVLAAAFADWRFGVYFDPLASLVVISLIFVGTFRLVRRALHILMQGTPPGLATEELRRDVIARFGLADMHHIHAWELGTGYHVLTAHLVAGPEGPLALLERVPAIRDYLRRTWHIEHATLEVEPKASAPCSLDVGPEI